MKTAFLGLDGVLCDFLGAALRLHGRDVDEVYAPPEAKGVRNAWELLGIDEAAFWKPINKQGYVFWSSLPWTPDGRRILAAVEAAFGEENVHLITSPCDDHWCVAGKASWVRYSLPKYARRLHLSPANWELAGKDKFLLDDGDVNCRRWGAMGGEFIKIARPWNARYGQAETAVGTLLDDIWSRLRTKVVFAEGVLA